MIVATPRVVIRTATASQLPQVRRLLDEAGLPTADLVEPGPRSTFVALDGAAVVGAVAIEPYAEAGLLRSLVVAPGWRGLGVGQALVAALEAHARAIGLERLVLLTQTAEAFFVARGYRSYERAQVPAAMRASPEFSSLCPASAACLSKLME